MCRVCRNQAVFAIENDGNGMRTALFTTALLALIFSVSGCDQIQQKMGLEDSAAKAARAEAEGKAVGGACRHSGRAIEDCYSIYTWVPKDAVYSGWRDMDSYMRDNKIETVEPQLPPAQPPGPKKKVTPSAQTATGDKETKAADKAPEKH
jgi:hypothetical protein